MLLSPQMGGLATNMAQSMGFWANLGKSPYFVAESPISGPNIIYKNWFFDKNVQLFFYKVFTEIGSLEPIIWANFVTKPPISGLSNI